MNIKGKTALVTGASRGIGRAIALALAQQGIYRLLLVARNPQRLAEVAAEVEEIGVEAVPLVVDLGDRIQTNVVLSQAWRDHGPVHILINCAGVAHQSPFLQSKLPEVQEEIAINLMGMYSVTRLIGRRMASQESGTIVNVASLMGKVAAPSMATYSATKFAILGFTQAIRGELAAYNIRVVSLLPSLTDTDMVRDLKWFRWAVPMTSEQVGQSLMNGLNKDSNEIIVGWQGQLAVLCNRLMPWLLEKTLQVAAPRFEDRSRVEYRLGHISDSSF